MIRLGKSVITLVRKLVELRRQLPQLRSGGHFFYNDYDRYQSKNVLLFSRTDTNNFSVIALNFGDEDQTVPFDFPFSGDYREELHGDDGLKGIVAGEGSWISIPSNYGRIWTLRTA